MNHDGEWVTEGIPDDVRDRESIPVFIEVAPDELKGVTDCTPSELRSAANSMLLQARVLAEDARYLIELAGANKNDC